MDTAAAAILIGAVFFRSVFKYGERGYRFVLIEAGHVAQNALLACAGRGPGRRSHRRLLRPRGGPGPGPGRSARVGGLRAAAGAERPMTSDRDHRDGHRATGVGLFSGRGAGPSARPRRVPAALLAAASGAPDGLGRPFRGPVRPRVAGPGAAATAGAGPVGPSQRRSRGRRRRRGSPHPGRRGRGRRPAAGRYVVVRRPGRSCRPDGGRARGRAPGRSRPPRPDQRQVLPVDRRASASTPTSTPRS